jgi:hypothetical protein
MTSWPRGEVIEVRRGGAGLLETLMADAATAGLDGLLHLRHGTAGSAALALRSGLVVGAHAAAEDVEVYGAEALATVRDLAGDGASVVEVHRLPPSLIEEVLAVHAGSRLHAARTSDEAWWRGRLARPARRRRSRLPSMAPSVGAPDTVASKVDLTRSRIRTEHVDVPPGAVRVVPCSNLDAIEAFAEAWGRAGGRSIVTRRRGDVEQHLERVWLTEDVLVLPSDLHPGVPLLVVLDDVHLLPVLLGPHRAFEQVADLADHVRDVGGVLLVPYDERLHSEEEGLRLQRLGSRLDPEHLAAFAGDPASLSSLGAMDAEALLERHERLAAWRPPVVETVVEDPVEPLVVVPVQPPAEHAPPPAEQRDVVNAPPPPRPAGPRPAQRARARRAAPRTAPPPRRFFMPKEMVGPDGLPALGRSFRRPEPDLVRNAKNVDVSMPPARTPTGLGLAQVRHIPDLTPPRFTLGTEMRDVLRSAPVVEAMGRRQRMWSELRLHLPRSVPHASPEPAAVDAPPAGVTPDAAPAPAPRRRTRTTSSTSKRRRLGGDADD